MKQIERSKIRQDLEENKVETLLCMKLLTNTITLVSAVTL